MFCYTYVCFAGLKARLNVVYRMSKLKTYLKIADILLQKLCVEQQKRIGKTMRTFQSKENHVNEKKERTCQK